MQGVLSNPWFHIIGVPIVLVLIGALASVLGRRSTNNKIQEIPLRNDCAVGTTTILMTIGTVMSDLHAKSDDSTAVITLLGWLMGFMFMAFLFICHDRYWSWARNGNGKPTESKHLFWGVILPTFIAVALYGYYRYSVGK